MTRSEFLARWSSLAAEFNRMSAHVDGAKVISAILADLESVFHHEDLDVLTLREAAEVSGYSLDHLGRLVRDGQIANVGRPHRPRVRRGDLPKKAILRAGPPTEILRMSSKGQIARSVVNSERGRHDG